MLEEKLQRLKEGNRVYKLHSSAAACMEVKFEQAERET
jgi:hypothetical protein